jgi:hypothetical protein
MQLFMAPRRWLPLAAASGLACALSFTATAALPDQTAGDVVGAIEGEAIAVTGPMTVDVAQGQVRTILRSGSDVQVKSGQARIQLAEGGQILICGPAHFSVLKSGGSLTLALDRGVIHARIERQPALTVYTPQIQAQPVSIGDAAQDTLVGFGSSDQMYIRAYRGAVRVEQQLTAQSVIVPQGGDVLLTNGRLDNLQAGGGRCSCELQVAKAAPPRPREASTAASAAEEVRVGELAVNSRPGPASAPAAKPVSKDEPIYQVFMPPLVYDASAAVQPEPDPRLIVLVRRVRVRPTLIVEGNVEGDPVAEAVEGPAPPITAPVKPPPEKRGAPAESSVMDRVRSFFRRLWSGKS